MNGPAKGFSKRISQTCQKLPMHARPKHSQVMQRHYQQEKSLKPLIISGEIIQTNEIGAYIANCY